MEIYAKDFLLSRILCDYDRIRINDSVYKIIQPTTEIIYEANEVFMDVFNEAQEQELYFDEDIYSILVSEGVWNKEKEIELVDTLPELIYDFQKQMFQAAYRETERELARSHLLKTRQRFHDLFSIRHQFDRYTCHGVAGYMKYHFIIENTTFHLDGTRVNWEKFPVSRVIEECDKNVIPLEQIREISHTVPWVNQWSAIKGLGDVFGKSGIQLSNAQHMLLMYSKMYDNINESPDCPDDFIIDDDDMLDGWILMQKETRDKERAEKNGTELVKKSKLDKANEVFIIADGEKAIERINKMNSARGQTMKKHRLKEIAQKGTIDYKNFSDVKQQVLTELAHKGK